LHRRFKISDSFSSPEVFGARVEVLERFLIRNDADDAARYLLGYAYYFSGNLFGARSVLKVLEERGAQFAQMNTMAREAERRLIKDR